MEQPAGDKEETEAIMSTEMEIVEEDAQGDQPDKAEARREPNWQDMMRFIAENFNKIDENFKKQEKQNRQTNELSLIHIFGAQRKRAVIRKEF